MKNFLITSLFFALACQGLFAAGEEGPDRQSPGQRGPGQGIKGQRPGAGPLNILGVAQQGDEMQPFLFELLPGGGPPPMPPGQGKPGEDPGKKPGIKENRVTPPGNPGGDKKGKLPPPPPPIRGFFSIGIDGHQLGRIEIETAEQTGDEGKPTPPKGFKAAILDIAPTKIEPEEMNNKTEEERQEFFKKNEEDWKNAKEIGTLQIHLKPEKMMNPAGGEIMIVVGSGEATVNGTTYRLVCLMPPPPHPPRRGNRKGQGSGRSGPPGHGFGEDHPHEGMPDEGPPDRE